MKGVVVTTTVQETNDRCDVSKVQIGDVWTRHDSGKVVGIRGHKIDLKNDNGDTWEISDSLVAKQFSFANQSDEEIKVSRTEMINILKDKKMTAMTVVYDKKPKESEVAKILATGQGDMAPRTWTSFVKKAIAGEERTMIGYHYGVMDDFDRLKFIEHGKGHRLVDTRTLKMLRVNRVTYVLK